MSWSFGNQFGEFKGPKSMVKLSGKVLPQLEAPYMLAVRQSIEESFFAPWRCTLISRSLIFLSLFGHFTTYKPRGNLANMSMKAPRCN